MLEKAQKELQDEKNHANRLVKNKDTKMDKFGEAFKDRVEHLKA